MQKAKVERGLTVNNAFTVDVEDGISFAMQNFFGVNSPQTDRVEKYTYQIIELLERRSIKGTFYVVGKVVEDFPNMIQEIHNLGHEVGIHGYNHLRFDQIDPLIAYREVFDTKRKVEDVIGSRVYGHRAPAFSINRNNSWALDILFEAGLVYDSSIVPAKGIAYGWEGFREDIHKTETPKGNEIIEVPLTITSFMGRSFPFCGGSYFRLLPFLFTQFAMNSAIKHHPAIFYMHPYELDYERYPNYYFDELNKQNWKTRLSMKSKWINRKSVYSKLDKLMDIYSFSRVIDLIPSEMFDSNKVN